MAKKVTTRKNLSGNTRSHAMNATKVSRKLNLQKYTTDSGVTVRLSAREIRTLKKSA